MPSTSSPPLSNDQPGYIASIRAAIYVRVHRDEKGEARGAPEQVEVCSAICAQRDWHVVEFYQDDDHSAFTGRGRPGYERLFGDAAQGRFEVVVAADPADLWRSPLEQQLFLAMGRQSRLELVATPAGVMAVEEGERSVFESLVGDLRHAVEELSRREDTTDPGQLSWMPSSMFPPSVDAADSRVLDAWDLMTPDERCIVVRAVLGAPAGPPDTGRAPGTAV
jgi:hypothetical protein